MSAELMAAIQRREKALARLVKLTAHIPRDRLIGILTSALSVAEIERLVSYQRQS